MIELTAAMIASAALLAGLGSVMFIARQVAYAPTASADRIEAARVAGDLSDELRYATLITQRSPSMIEFVIADRDGDNRAERIGYSWSGIPGEPLYKTLNANDPTIVIPSVQQFLIEYAVEDELTTLETTTDTSEMVVAEYVAAGNNRDRAIGASGSTNPWVAQQINPAAAAPAGALWWNATRVRFTADPSGSADETLRVELRLSGDNSPTSHVLTAIDIAEASLNGSKYFDLPIRRLSLSRQHAIVWANYGSGEAARLYYNDADQLTTSVLESANGGASWRFAADQQVYYQILGTYTYVVPGLTYNVTRKYVPRVRITLQPDEQTHSRVEAGIPLINRPELLSAYWRTDFDTDPASDPMNPTLRNPTNIYANGDDEPDWTMRDGDAFNAAIPPSNHGEWQVSGELRTRPENDFTGVTIVEARCRAGGIVRINADRQGGLQAPLTVRVAAQGNNTQRLTLDGESSPGVTQTLCSIADLPGDLNDDSSFIRFRLLILPSQDLVNLQVNGEDQGTSSYPTYGPLSAERFVSLSGNGAEFDYVEVRVSDSALVQQQ